MLNKIFFNSDVGEEAGFDKEIMPYLSYCNIACGAHAGNEMVIRETIDLALEYDVKIGAHPSYPDRQNFGRVSLELSHDEIRKTLIDQIELVKFWTEKAGVKLHHVKPHGALYNDACIHEAVATNVVECVKSIDKSLRLIAPKNSIISYLSSDKVEVLYEVFADRNYHEDLILVARSEKNSVLTDPQKVFEHISPMILDNTIKTISGVEVSVFFDTICIHGDNPKSVQILEYVYKRLRDVNFER